MELNNLEKQIQEKMLQRSINPSSNSWDRLEAMLTIAEKPKKKKFPFAIAASFIVVSFILFFLLKEDKIIKLNNQIKSKPVVLIENKKIIENKVHTTTKYLPNKIEVIKKKQLVEGYNSKKDVPQLFGQEETKQPQVVEENSKEYVYMSAEELLATTQSQFDVKTKNDTHKKLIVNPDELLNIAEKELDQKYRNNTINKINNSYNFIKSALVNRNQE